MTWVQAPPEWQATTVQACGMWPFVTGANAPTVGVPLGRHLRTGTTVCFDPIGWFAIARLISNPSAFLLGLPGFGKSALAKKLALGCAAFGITPVIGGDLKGEYAPLIRALGGQVIELGRGRGHLNVLDMSVMTQAARRLPERQRLQLLAEAAGRRHTMVSALLTLMRHEPPTAHQRSCSARRSRSWMTGTTGCRCSRTSRP